MKGRGPRERVNPDRRSPRPVTASPTQRRHRHPPSSSPARPAWTSGAAIVEGGLVAQFEQALTNLLTALATPAAQPPRDLASITSTSSTWTTSCPGAGDR